LPWKRKEIKRKKQINTIRIWPPIPAEQGLTLLSGRMLLFLWYGDSTLNAFPYKISNERKSIKKRKKLWNWLGKQRTKN